MKKIEVTGIGADIEVFLKDRNTDEIVSAEGYIEGSKYSPHLFDKENSFFSTSLDNVLAEFTIPPSLSPDDFLANIQKGLSYIDEVIPDHLCTAAVPAAILDDMYLFTENAMIFGCEPDFNAYTRTINMKDGEAEYNLRSGGGHIHIGYSNPTSLDGYQFNDERIEIVKALDLFIGIPSVILEPDNQRKLLYGTAGSFRPKKYGVEYRTLSNYYLQSQELIKWVYNSAQKAVDFLNDGNKVESDLAQVVQNTINSNDKKMAETLINNYKLELVS